MSAASAVRALAGRVRRLLLPELDLITLQRRRFVRLVPPGSRVLDAGCGDGAVAFQLARRGCRVLGVSHDARAVASLRERATTCGLPPQRVDFRVHDLARGEPLRGPFDVVVCFDVLEHIRDDRAAVATLAGALRPGGRLLLTVPDRSAPPVWGDRVSATEDGGHVRQGYTREELGVLVGREALRVVRWRGFAGFFAQKATSVGRRLEARGGRAAMVVRGLWALAARPACWLDPLLPWPDYELLVVAEKPAPGGPDG